jgi:hypothetical protein
MPTGAEPRATDPAGPAVYSGRPVGAGKNTRMGSRAKLYRGQCAVHKRLCCRNKKRWVRVMRTRSVLLGSVLLTATLASVDACAAAQAPGAIQGSSSDGGASTTRGAGMHEFPTADYRGPITQPAYLQQAGIEMTVPTGEPAVTWKQAYENCQTGDAVCDVTATPIVTLATVTTKDAGEAGEGGKIVPLMDRTLAYVITQEGVGCSPVGPPAEAPSRTIPVGPPPGSSTETRTAGRRPGPGDQALSSGFVSCTVINFVDAATGMVLYSVQGPNL